MKHIAVVGTIWLAAITTVACSATPKAPPKGALIEPPMAAGSVSQSLTPAERAQALPGRIAVAKSIREACGVSDAEAYFAYDSATVPAEHRMTLSKLVECFNEGPMRGRSMLLVGHADPRGEDSYNLALGGRRADNVKMLLLSEGLPDRLAQTSSRGEMDARGSNEPEWAMDRRVEVMLLD